MATIVEHQHGIRTYHNHGTLVGYSNMETGNMSRRFGALKEVKVNREKLRQVMGDGAYILESVEHGNNIIDLGDRTATDGAWYRGDGIFTTRSDVVLEVIVSDCIAMVIYDAKHASTLGLIHVGRKGASRKIHLKALDYITTDHYDVPKQDVCVFLPPAIRKQSYYFHDLPPEMQVEAWRNFIDNGHVDLVRRVVHDLINAGLKPEQIIQDTTDVGAFDTPYFSHSLQKKGLCPPGRNAVAARLLPRPN